MSRVVETHLNTEVNLVQYGASWSEVEKDGTRCWIATRLLGGQGDTEVVADSGPAYTPPRQSLIGADLGSGAVGKSSYAPAKKKRSSSTRRSTGSKSGGASRFYNGGECPCSGSNICIGPRGGRYCITSGGNKRYGV